jgi:hypothetical protein
MSGEAAAMTVHGGRERGVMTVHGSGPGCRP